MITTDRDLVSKWVGNMCEADFRSAVAAIGWTRDDDLTCGVMYEHFTGRSITATIAAAPGAVWPRQFLRAIFDYPFKQLNVQKILAYIEEANWKSCALVERMGFSVEAKVQHVFPSGAMLIYTVTADKCHWLESENGQED
jgi:L-amino acid N-acyltransferase YncA